MKEWGGLPTTAWLRHADRHLEAETKRRYHHFLEQNVPGWTAPTPAEEAANQDETNKRYGSAVRWLLEYTRDTKQFKLIFAELISYGFRRNALGLRSVGIILALASTGFAAAQLYDVPFNNFVSDYFSQLAAGVVSILILLWWTFGVSKSWVRDAGDAYAKALLGACDRSQT